MPSIKKNKKTKITKKDIITDAKELSKSELRKLDREAEKVSRRKLKKISELQPGELIVYKYKNPKTKEQMEKFDAAPLTIVLDVYTKKGTQYLLGINLHWVSPGNRKKVFEYIIKNYMKLDFFLTKDKLISTKRKRFFNLIYQDIKNDPFLSKEILGNNALRLYIVKRGKDYRRVPLKYYNIIFGPQGRNLARSRWAYQSKGYKLNKF